MCALFQLMRAASWLACRPFAQAIDSVGQATVLFFGLAVRIKASKVCARLDQRGDAARQPVTLRVALTQLRREQIRQLYLAYLTFNLSIGHRGIEIMLKPRLR
jgi:hypothetical protein